MRRTKKFLVGLLACLSMAFGAFAVACGGEACSSSSSSSSSSSEQSNTEQGTEDSSSGGGLNDSSDKKDDSSVDSSDSSDVVQHTHEYNQEVAETKYLNTVATCESKATYYKSCLCGEFGEETFEYGENAECSFENGVCKWCKAIQIKSLEYTLKNDNTYEVSGIGTCTDTEIVLPSQYNGLPVTSIGGNAFGGCTGLTSVTIPDSVTSIGPVAFDGCISLTSVYYSGDIVGWCGIDFGYALDLFNRWTANPLYYAKNLYLQEELLTGDIIIPNGVTAIGRLVFAGCNVTGVTIPDSVAYIGEGAFWECTSLTSVTIGDSVKSIGEWAFIGCTGLASVTIPNSVVCIGEGAFSGCTGLASVTIPNSVVCIGEGAFSGCTGLASVTIPNSVVCIGVRAFSGCTGLTSVTMGNSVTSILWCAFEDCENLDNIIFSGTMEEWNAISKCWDWKRNIPATKVVCSNGEVEI